MENHLLTMVYGEAGVIAAMGLYIIKLHVQAYRDSRRRERESELIIQYLAGKLDEKLGGN